MLAGVLADRMIEGVKFGLGPVMAARRKAIGAAGGFAPFQNYLTEDFLIGRRIAECGFGTILSSCVVEHRLGTQGWRENLAHRLRWMRGGRRMRPVGYVAQLFTHPLPLTLALLAVRPGWWLVAVAAVALRLASAWATAVLVVRDGSVFRRPWLLPLQDLLGFSLWIAGFFGKLVTWRGHRYVLNADGTFHLVGGSSHPLGG
jgi:ceramide glucosyltransferase